MAPDWDASRPESQAYSRELERRAEELFRGKPSAEWLHLLAERGIPAGPVRFIEEMFDDPQVAANGLVDEFTHIQEGAVKMVGPVARFSGAPRAPRPPVARPGPARRRNPGVAGLCPRGGGAAAGIRRGGLSASGIDKPPDLWQTVFATASLIPVPRRNRSLISYLRKSPRAPLRTMLGDIEIGYCSNYLTVAAREFLPLFLWDLVTRFGEFPGVSFRHATRPHLSW